MILNKDLKCKLLKEKIKVLIDFDDTKKIMEDNELDRARKRYENIQKILYPDNEKLMLLESNEKKQAEELKRIKECREEILDNMFKFLWENDLTFKQIESAINKREKKSEMFKLEVLLEKKQEDYYLNVLKYIIENEGKATATSISDWGVYIDEQRYKNVIRKECIEESSGEKSSVISEYFIRNLDVIANGFYINKNMDITTYKKNLNNCKIQYKNFVENNKWYKNDLGRNPFLILYVHLMNSKVLKKSLFKVTKDELLLNKYMHNIGYIMLDKNEKNITTRNVAEYLNIIDPEKYSDIKKVMDNIRKCFKKLNNLEKYKVKNEYVFTNIYYPLACYLYYSKKQNAESFENNLNLIYKIIPIIKSNLDGNGEYIELLREYINFIEDQIENIYTSLNYRYQLSALDILSEGLVNLYGLSIGIPEESIFFREQHLGEVFW